MGNPHEAQISQFELFELILSFELDKQLLVEQFEATASQSRAPSPPLSPAALARIRFRPGEARLGSRAPERKCTGPRGHQLVVNGRAFRRTPPPEAGNMWHQGG